MQPRTLAAAAVALLVVASGAVLLAGVVPLPGDVVDAPRPTATDGGDGSSPGGDGTATPGNGMATPGDGSGSGGGSDGGPEFRLEIDDVEECGTTCRDVTTTLTNVGNESASDVFVRTTLFVGNSTDESDQIWEGTEDVGTLAAGESYTATKRVTLSLSEGFAVRQADGWVTIRTTIRTAGGSVTYTERRDVD